MGFRTQTRPETHIIGGSTAILGNDVLANIAQCNLEGWAATATPGTEKQLARTAQDGAPGSCPPTRIRPLAAWAAVSTLEK